MTSLQLRRQCRKIRPPAAVSFLLVSSRHVRGGCGRGDLYFVNPEASHRSARISGMLWGVRHSTQATCPESGQLHYRKLMLHARPNGPSGSLERHCGDTCNWSYLVPSLQRCSELAIHDDLWKKLCQLELGGISDIRLHLTKRECQRVQDGQNIYRYELHQRLPLLEESIQRAELGHLLGLFHSARRARVRLTTSPALTVEEGVESLETPSPESLSCRAVVNAAGCDTTPGRNQIFDVSSRVSGLVDAALARMCELWCFCDSEEGTTDNCDTKGISARQRAKKRQVARRFDEELRWHGIKTSQGAGIVKQ
uniref:Uncharacterized protein n=1 Tax=Trypanosoma congolense (strain IL3000) TaxID=1068625 RepID=G0UXN1_TRYCI|nr:conserved hypothetical protein [Trypanosoma congolense IL3000]